MPNKNQLQKYICEGYLYTEDGEELYVEARLEASSRREAVCSLMIIRENNKFLVDGKWIEGGMLIDVRKTRKSHA